MSRVSASTGPAVNLAVSLILSREAPLRAACFVAQIHDPTTVGTVKHATVDYAARKGRFATMGIV